MNETPNMVTVNGREVAIGDERNLLELLAARFD